MNNRHRRNGKRHTSYLSTKSTSETLFHQLASSCVILSLGGYGRFPAGACVLAEQGEKLKPFIPAWLDDLNLSLKQFRLYCHIGRRGNCFDSVATMVRVCRIDRHAIRGTIAELIKLGLITATERPGQSTLYVLADTESRVATPPGKRPTPPDLREPSPPGIRDTKAILLKGNPIKGEKDLSSFHDWQLTKDEEKLTAKIQRLKEADLPDQPLINFHVQSRKAIREEQRRRGAVL